MVGARGFEPPASASRTQRSTRLSYAPMLLAWVGYSPFQSNAQYQRWRATLAAIFRLLLLLTMLSGFIFSQAWLGSTHIFNP